MDTEHQTTTASNGRPICSCGDFNCASLDTEAYWTDYFRWERQRFDKD